VAQKLTLAEEQFEQIHEIVTEMDQEVAAVAQAGRDQMRAQFQRQNPQNGNNGGGQGGVAVATKKAAVPNADPEGDPAANNQAAQQQRNAQNAQRFQAMSEEMAKLADQEDAITQQAEKAIGKVLTSRQKKSFNSMLGSEYDLTKLVAADQFPGGPGGPGRRGQAGPNGNNPRTAQGAATPPAGGNANPPTAAPDDTDNTPAKPATRNRPAPRVRGQAPASNPG
jgi:hypothetical protein